MSKTKEVVQNENVIQAVIVADTFDDEFIPISDTIPHVSQISFLDHTIVQ